MFKILVVEDDIDLNKTVCSYLNGNGYEAVGCLEANEAYNEMYGNVFDLIISDIMMPKIDGFEFAKTVRSLNKEIPILFMTARDDFNSKQRGYGIGIDDYMVKPIDLMMLVLSTAMGGMTFQMIWQNRSYEYKGYIIYISALYAFYSFITAVVNVVKFSRINNAILSAAKILALAGALMSMFALQTAMFSSFGGGAELQQLMNTITGTAVCVLTIGMAVFMIVRANICLKKSENTQLQRSGFNG